LGSACARTLVWEPKHAESGTISRARTRVLMARVSPKWSIVFISKLSFEGPDEPHRPLGVRLPVDDEAPGGVPLQRPVEGAVAEREDRGDGAVRIEFVRFDGVMRPLGNASSVISHPL